MTEAERKIAKLSRTLNNASLYTHSNNQIDEDAYLTTIKNLQTSLQSEKTKNSEVKNKYTLSIQTKLNEDSLKELTYKHHFKVLEAQIKENQLKKQLINESESGIPSFYLFRTENKPQKNIALREELANQIKEKQDMRKQQISNDIAYHRQMIEKSNKNLDDEYNLRAFVKEKAYKNLIDSWEENSKLKKIQKDLEKMIMYGPKPEPPAIFQNDNDT